jgi:hypothetical protein
MRLYELNDEEIDKDTFVRLLKDSLRQNRVNVKEAHLITVADILFGRFSTSIAGDGNRYHLGEHQNRDLKELLSENGVTSAELTLAIGSTMQMYLERMKTLSTLDKPIEKEVNLLSEFQLKVSGDQELSLTIL